MFVSKVLSHWSLWWGWVSIRCTLVEGNKGEDVLGELADAVGHVLVCGVVD